METEYGVKIEICDENRNIAGSMGRIENRTRAVIKVEMQSCDAFLWELRGSGRPLVQIMNYIIIGPTYMI